jgi:hypothetical protein
LKLNNKHIPLKEIKAEVFINKNFDFQREKEINLLGCFYRNFCEDIIEINSDNKNNIRIFLSRDSIFNLLPETLFFDEQSLLIKKKSRTKQKTKINKEAVVYEMQKQQSQKKTLKSFFKFFDGKLFDLTLLLEKHVMEILSNKNDLLLKNVLNIDVGKINNKYILKLSHLLLYSNQIRGNLLLINEIIVAALEEKVEIRRKSYFCSEIKESYSVVEFIIHIKKLSRKQYNELNDLYRPLFLFIAEWFLPFDVDSEYIIKDKAETFILDKKLILDYNTQL